ncbi:unnamed protein product [Ostreobium quekettii]|uniref:Protein kinase domain-containing protein n=1 Tax=Ostreobium quekettii TaxID=121088 RepID=A0A8S1JBK3_9CHLO|nr:unnamed protein product [Ostreobium quekettii]
MRAAQNGHTSIVALLLEKGASANHANKDSSTALMWAARNGHMSTVASLLEKGASVDQVDEDGSTALTWAARNGHTSTVASLLEKGATVELADENGSTALMQAAQNGHTSTVALLLEKGASVDQASKDSSTVLMRAAQNGHTSTVALLLKMGTSVDQASKDGTTALMQAAQDGHASTVALLLEKGALVDKDDDNSSTALTLAARNGHTSTVASLLEKGATVDQADQYGSTPLTWAARNGHTSTVVLLLERGASVDQADMAGKTPLMQACMLDNGIRAAEIVRILLHHGADVDGADENGLTALIGAAQKGHTRMVALLLHGGASVDQADKNLSTALIYAAKGGHDGTAMSLVAHGASVNHCNKDGRTPLWYATEGHSGVVIGLLMGNGARMESLTYNAGIVTFLLKQMMVVKSINGDEESKSILRKGDRFAQKHEIPFCLKNFYTVDDARQAAQSFCWALRDSKCVRSRGLQSQIEAVIPESIITKDREHLRDMLSYVLRGKEWSSASKGLLHKWEDARDKHEQWSRQWAVQEEDVEVMRMLGKGGQGCVHKCQYKDKVAAVKMPASYKPGLPIDDFAVLLKEAYWHSELNSLHAPQLFAITKSGWIVMELADKDLRTLCQEQDIGWARKLLLQKGAFALMYFHSHRIVHSDVKTHNFLVFESHQDDCDVKLADFGLATEETSTRCLTVRLGGGTDVYLAPEVYHNEAPTMASDVYAFGVIMYEVITGKQPYSAEGQPLNPQAIMMRKTLGQMEPCSIAPEDCPEEMHILMKKCCQEDPGGRPSIHEVYAQLSAMPKSWVHTGSSVEKLTAIVVEAEKEVERALYNKKMLVFLYQQMQKVKEMNDISIQASNESIPEAFESLKVNLLLGTKLIKHHSQVFIQHCFYPIREAKFLIEKICTDCRTAIRKLSCSSRKEIVCKIPKSCVDQDKSAMGNILEYILGESDAHLQDAWKEWKQVKDRNAELLHQLQPTCNEQIPLQDEYVLCENDDVQVYEAEWEGSNVMVKFQHPTRDRVACLESFAEVCSFLALHACKKSAHIASVVAYSTSGSIVMKGGEADLVGWYQEQGTGLSWKSRIYVMWQASAALDRLHSGPTALAHCRLETKSFLVDDLGEEFPLVTLCCFKLANCGPDAQKIEVQQPRRFVCLFDAPELQRGGLRTLKSDVYSFGLVLWELAVQMSPSEMRCGHQGTGANKLLNTVPSDCPTKLKSVIESCLSPAPSKRRSMREVHGELTVLKEEFIGQYSSAV